MKRISLEPAYILHRRHYRETSVLLEVWSKQQGRLTVIAKGVRQAKSPLSGLAQPFIPLLVTCAGRGELLALSQLEINGMARILQGDYLFAGLYLNELLTCLLQKWDPHPQLFDSYEIALQGLELQRDLEPVLRSFEKSLLTELGYGVLPHDLKLAEHAFCAHSFYRFMTDQGFIKATASEVQDAASRLQHHVFSAQTLIAISREDWALPGVLAEAKRLTRIVLAPLLGARPIYSRRLFLQLEKEVNDEI
jgi:DNA repair protein RecO (recombination protein O)